MTRQDGIDRLIVRAVALACRTEPGMIDRRTEMADLQMDSLTLVAVLSQIEAAFDVSFTVDDTMDVIAARDIDELIAAVRRCVTRA